ncbi:ligase-associated DNA damage response endonuclease PdeM [Enterovirga rhinocerotis]|uniref:Putative phosphoesterase n=1 Tax=Enterovirga rhinocerotis TaxID=1339210 RepID=A0A4R7C5K1_9HYPH|nr:ligase-associated DNA damage response endonuclease PdeM [Enterovirga rhinocerotis]TDR93363.1 putative phosphoesterase [Enterovirga rhinocerotis]
MTASRAAVPQAGRIAPVELTIAGQACLLDHSGVLVLPDAGTLVVADLHLEKGSSLARRGSLLPPYDTGATLARLAEVVAHYRPARVVALGDSFHDRGGPERLAELDRAALRRLTGGCDWTWVVGNHDPVLPPAIGGEVVEEVAIGSLVLRHHPAAGPVRELAGHLHPVARVVMHGRGVRARAFLTDGGRCVLPAFGAYAGGLNACDAAFAPLFPAGFTAHVLGRSRIFALSRGVLCGD